MTIQSRLNIFQRIAAGYGLILVIMIATGILTVTSVQQLKTSVDDLSRNEFPALEALRGLTSKLYLEEVPITQYRGSSLSGSAREALLYPYFLGKSPHSIEELMKRADQVMYKQKQAKKGAEA